MTKPVRILSSLLILGVVFFFGWESANYTAMKQALNRNGSSKETTTHQNIPGSSLFSNNTLADLGLFWKVWKSLDERYVDETVLGQQSRVYGAIKGMVNSLNDPYTVFMTPDETKDFESNLNGTLEGIGAELTKKDQMLVIISPLKDSPAAKAGLLPGDIVYKIDGQMTNEMALLEAISKIRGQKGTKVVLSILRKKDDNTLLAPLEISITREEVNIESVTTEEKNNGIHVIAIHEFSDNTKAEFDKIIQKIILKDPKGIIVDLRYNGGGYLDTSVDLLSEFLPGKKAAVIIKKRNGSADESIYVSGNAPLADVPLIVLVNKGSASASEIFAGAIHDHKRGLIVGEQTFGKGSVQEVDKMSDGSSIRMTIAKWYTPNGQSISEVGITPDVVIPYTEKDAEAQKDPQMEEALKRMKTMQ